MKRIGLAVLAVLLIASVVALYMWNKPHRDVANEEAAFTMASADLADAFAANRSLADSMYLEQAILVSGVISSIEGDSVPTIILPGVVCTMQASEKNTIPEVGTSVKIKGRCVAYDDLFGEVKLDHCTWQ